MILKYKNTDNSFFNIKQVAKEYFDMSERLIAKLKNKKLIFLNGKMAYINEVLKLNDIIEFNLDYSEETDNIVPVKMDLEILFEDDALIIVNKPAFMPIHPSSNHFSDTLSNGIKYYFESIHLNKKIRPINRLDRNTSGICIFAKNEYIQEALIKQMQLGIFKKKYLAVLEGILNEKSGTITAPIARKTNSIMEREINFESGKNAVTSFKVIKEAQNYSLVEFELHTGRNHQIRVHSKFIGHPILGDSLYSNPSKLINRQALHAYKISFIHPITKKEIFIEANLPNDISILF
jgi:23S rRNA pseudouridine1911/1915/1917 synthase